MKKLLLAYLVAQAVAAPALAENLMPEEIYILIRNARPTVHDPDGWVTDLLGVLNEHSLQPSKENVCATIAVIDQESNFNPNPSVPGLGKLAEKALREKFGHVPLLGQMGINFLDTHPKGQASYLQRIKTAKTEHDLDLTYRAFINDFGTASNMSMIVQSGLLNRIIEERNDISTIGSMQVSVKFALNDARGRRYLPMTLSDDYAVREDLYTRRGGIYYGVKQLLSYDTGYDRKIYRFADFNSGRYSSRNAAFQHIVGALAKQKLEREGDLLLYAKNGSV